MRVSSWLLLSPARTIELTATVVAIAIILLATSMTITNAQQQQLTSQPGEIENGTAAMTIFQSTNDSFRVQVPEGWVIYDVNNTGSALSEESTQGYGILAQLCPQEQQQQPLSNVSGGDTVSCQGSEEDVIHIVRYPDLDTRLQVSSNVTTNNNIMTADNILLYHLQKLREVGYRDIQIANSTETTVNLTNAQTNQTIAEVPAKTVEMTYATAIAPNETRSGYIISTATNATAPNLGRTKGYTIFYESISTAETTLSGSLASTSLPVPVRQVIDSFELISAAPTEPLTVEITSSDTEGVAPATFEFEANMTGGTEPYTYSWDFDDEGSGENNEQTVSHTFEEAGTYNVALTVTDSGGQIGSDSMEITVEEAPEEEQAAEEDDTSGSDDLIDIDEFIDDLFDRLGLR